MEYQFKIKNDKIYLTVKVIPGSSKNQICGNKNNLSQQLKIKIAAPAEDGKANEELRSFLAKQLGCAKRDADIITGDKSRIKTVALPVCVMDKLKSFFA